MNHKRYKTKGLDCWQKAKELRLNEYKDLVKAKEEGKVLVSGCSRLTKAILAGIGDHIFMAGEPYGATVSTNNEFSRQCLEEVESRGYARDLCAYMRNYLGSMFLNRYFFGGEFPRPDFLYFDHICDTHAKWCQMVADHYKIESFGIDMPVVDNYKDIDNTVEYLVSQLRVAIESLEKATKRKYDDEKLIEAVNSELKIGRYGAEICFLNQTIPAPLDVKSMYSFIPLSVHLRHKKEGAEFFKLLRDEIKERVQNQIAALATERCRLLTINAPPWYFLRLVRYIEKFGCAVIGGSYPYSAIGGWGFKLQPDGIYAVAEIPEDNGKELKTRDDALQALVVAHLDDPFLNSECVPWKKSAEQLGLVKQWHGDGMVIHLDRACEFGGAGNNEAKLLLQKEGIPVLVFEGNRSDARDFNEVETLNNVEAFMESLGLKMLPD